MKNALIPSVLLSSVIFAGLTFPLAAAGSQPLEIKLQREQVFVGTLRDISSPYLALAGLISVGAGMVNLSISGWRHSSRKSTQIDNHLSKMQAELQRKESQIEDLRLSLPYLRATGLDAFLEPNPAVKVQEVAQIESPVTAAEVAQSAALHNQAPSSVGSQTAQSLTADSVNLPLVLVNPVASASPLVPSASSLAPQSYVAEVQSVNPQTEVVVSQIHELKQQLQQMASQISMLQHQSPAQAAPLAPKPVQQEAAVSSGQIIEHLHRRLQHLESDWLRQKFAS